MSGLRSNLPYREGKYKDLDEKWKKFKTKRIFGGDAWREELTEKEIENLVEIWRKKRYTPSKLTFREVSIYVEKWKRIFDYRKRVQRELARLRKHRSREKIRAAAKQGVSAAIKHIESVKKSNRDHIAKLRKEKRKSPKTN